MIREKAVLASLAIFMLCSTTSALGSSMFPADEQKLVVEREKRLLQMAGSKLDGLSKLVQEDIAVLEHERDTITPAEPSRREEDLTELLNWHYRHAEFLSDEEDAISTLMADLSTPGAPPENLDVFNTMGDKERGFAMEMAGKAEQYISERNSLTALMQHRQRLLARCLELKEKLVRVAGKDGEAARSDRDQEEERLLRKQLDLLQTELRNLPDVDEATITHYTALVEFCQWQKEWLSLEIEVYDTLGSIAALVPAGDARDYGAIIHAHERLVKTFESQIVRLKRMSDEIDRKRTKGIAAGSFLQAQRSRELNEMFDRLKDRLDGKIKELRVSVGASEAEVAELRSAQR